MASVPPSHVELGANVALIGGVAAVGATAGLMLEKHANRKHSKARRVGAAVVVGLCGAWLSGVVISGVSESAKGTFIGGLVAVGASVGIAIAHDYLMDDPDQRILPFDLPFQDK